MALPIIKAFILEDREAEADEFVPNRSIYRYAHIAHFNPNSHIVVFETRCSEELWLADIDVKTGRGIPSGQELMEHGTPCNADPVITLYRISCPLIDVTSLKCDCGLHCKLQISNRSKIKDREQAVCPKTKPDKPCKYRQWFDTAHIQCGCDVPADITKASGLNNPANKNREYFRCGHYKDKRGSPCDFFHWKSDLAGYLREDWGASSMPIERALQGLLKIYKDEPAYTFSDSHRMEVPYNIRSTLAGYCKQNPTA